MSIGGYPFQLVGSLDLERDASGAILRDMPQARYRKAATARLHRYGAGPFCRFRLVTDAGAGVYAFVIVDAVMYIGRSRGRLAGRINPGYGRISPRHCYIGGQEPSCRVNNLILQARESGDVVEVWFYACDPPDAAETYLINLLQPPWNLAGVRRGAVLHRT